MAAITTSAPVIAVKKVVKSSVVVERRLFNNKPMIVLYNEGQEANFKAYAYNAGAPKTEVLFGSDKDGDSILMEMLKFAVDNGMSMEKAESAVNALSESFKKYKDATDVLS